MRVALDIDETITKHPEFFAFLSKALMDAGHRVFIVTFRWHREETERDLAQMGISYHELHLEEDQEVFRHTGFYEWKANKCRELGVDVLFEDMTPVAHLLDGDVLTFVPYDKDQHAELAFNFREKDMP